MDLDFGSLIANVNRSVGELDKNTAQAQGVMQTATDIADGRATQARETASAAERMTRIKLEDQARQENTRRRVAGDIGTDPSQIGYLIPGIAQRVKDADETIQSEAAQIAQIDSVGFLDNPVQFLLGQLQRKQHVAAHNAAVDAMDEAKDYAGTLDKLTTDSFKNINALTQTVSEAYIQSATLVEANQYNSQAADAALQAVRYNFEGIRLAGERTKDQLGIMFQANTARNAEQQIKISLAHLNIASKEFDLKKQAFDEKTSEDSLILKYVQTGYLAQSGKQMDPARAKEVVMLWRNKNPDIQAMFDSGLATSMSGHLMITPSAFDATTLYATGKLSNLPPTQKLVAEELVTLRGKWEKTQAGMEAVQSKDKTAMERGFNTFVEEYQKQGFTEIYKPMPLSQAATTSKVIQASPVWNTILKPAADAGVNVDDPNIAFGLITSSVQSGKLSYEDAVGYSHVMASALDLNNQAKNFLTFGLPPATSYTAGVTMPMAFGKSPVNVVDNKEFATALNKALSLQIIQQNTGINVGGLGRIATGVGKVAGSIPLQYGSKLQYDPGTEHQRLLDQRRAREAKE